MSRHWTLLVIASVLVLIPGTIFTRTNTGVQLDAAEHCPVDNILSLSHEEQEQCIQKAGGKRGFVATVEAIQLETAHAQPTHGVTTTPRPTRTVTPIGYTPPYVGRIEPISNEGQDFRGTQSVWIVGAVQNTDGRHFPFYVFTNETRCGIGTIVETEGFDAPFLGVPVNEHWNCPEDAGILTITDVTNSMGSVSFENEQGQLGTFNLTTEAWTLEGEPWLPAATPTP
ncbi:hypothetical protein HC928_16110 [bacterium]|nr:hypothetical protein [bacterium]